MRKFTIFIFFSTLCVALYTSIFVFKKPDFIYQKVESYQVHSLEESFGSTRLSPEYEQKIQAIAQQLGMHEKITIKRMNHRALQAYGYCNALAAHPQFLGIFPVVEKPYIFISQGFFEELSEEEQVFIIGHELAHIRERHVCYINLIHLMLEILILCIWWFLIKRRLDNWIIAKSWSTSIKNALLRISQLICFLTLLFIPDFGILAYRRHIEREADSISWSMLNVHDGALSIMDRWQKVYKMQEYNGYMDLFTDHPSLALRKKCCLEHKQTQTTKDQA